MRHGLVVPMVPFITHRSARDLLAAEFEGSPHKPSAELINLVGGHRALTDMRLIRNIRNEFEIYRAAVLSDSSSQSSPPVMTMSGGGEAAAIATSSP